MTRKYYHHHHGHPPNGSPRTSSGRRMSNGNKRGSMNGHGHGSHRPPPPPLHHGHHHHPNNGRDGGSNRSVGLALFAGMTVALFFQLGQYSRSLLLDSSHPSLLMNTKSKSKGNLKGKTIPVTPPVVPKENTQPKIDVGTLRNSVTQQAAAQGQQPIKSPINANVVSNDVARMIANKLAKQYEFNPEPPADTGIAEAAITQQQQQPDTKPFFQFQDAFALDGNSNNNNQQQQQPAAVPPKAKGIQISLADIPPDAADNPQPGIPFDRDEDNRYGDDGVDQGDDDSPGDEPLWNQQEQAQVRQALKIVPIPLVSSDQVPKDMPKYEGDLPDDWNEILKLRAAFMQKHHPPPQPPQVSVGKGISVSINNNPAQPQFGPNGEPIILLRTDALYQKNTWDKSPIVMEEFKLVFFTVPKVGCTAFKQLFRRMKGFPNWKDHQYYSEPFLPHNPSANGLKYLSDYPFEQANEMLTSPDWTRAIFVRKPEERVLSAFLDKAGMSKGYYLRMKCCEKVSPRTAEWNLLQCATGTKQYTPPAPGETNTPILSFEEFLRDIMPKCNDPHWEPQAIRMAPKYWERINFVGRFETIYEDTKELLTKLNAWDQYGATGWDVDGTDGAIFDPRQKAQHGTKARDKDSKSKYFTANALSMIGQYYDMDFIHQKLNFERPQY